MGSSGEGIDVARLAERHRTLIPATLRRSVLVEEAVCRSRAPL